MIYCQLKPSKLLNLKYDSRPHGMIGDLCWRKVAVYDLVDDLGKYSIHYYAIYHKDYARNNAYPTYPFYVENKEFPGDFNAVEHIIKRDLKLI